jgi:hypothetical protein
MPYGQWDKTRLDFLNKVDFTATCAAAHPKSDQISSCHSREINLFISRSIARYLTNGKGPERIKVVLGSVSRLQRRMSCKTKPCRPHNNHCEMSIISIYREAVLKHERIAMPLNSRAFLFIWKTKSDLLRSENYFFQKIAARKKKKTKAATTFRYCRAHSQRRRRVDSKLTWQIEWSCPIVSRCREHGKTWY